MFDPCQEKYDTAGRVVQEVKVISGSGTFKSEWWYNSADLVAWMKYPADNNGNLGEAVVTTYHPQMLVDNVWGTNTYVQSSSYDAAGRLVQLVRGQGALTTNYTYYGWTETSDLAGQQVGQGGRLKQIATGSLQDLRYLYDAAGNVRKIEDYKLGSPQEQNFSYDALDRLTSAEAVNGTGGNYSLENYQYHATSGNISNKAGQDYTYNAQLSCSAGNRTIPHAASSYAGNSYGYDCNGNMITRTIGTTTYTLSYDAENRMTGVSGGGLSASFDYDGDGNRVKGTVNSATTVYIGNHFEWSGSTSSMQKYYYAGGVRVAMRTGAGNPIWLMGDHLGSTSTAANYNGTLMTDGEVRYKAWGEKRYPAGSSAIPTTYRYTGQRQEKLLSGVDGLYFYNARWYDPGLMQFNQPDTLISDIYDPLDWNRYSYVRYNPLTYTDPSGHDPCTGTQGTYHPDCGIDGWYATSPDVWTKGEKAQAQAEFDKVGDVIHTIGTIASVFVEPIDWVITAGECLGGNCSPWIALGMLPLIPGNQADDIGEGLINFARKGKFGETIDTIRGRASHANYPLALGPNYDYRVRLPSGLRPDAVDWENHIVRELKPDNPNAIRRGWHQVRKYLNELSDIFDEAWTAYVDTYNK